MLRFLHRPPPAMNFSILSRTLFSTPSLHPSARETHVWYVLPNEVKDLSLLNHYQELLSPCERQTIFSIKDTHLQKCALLSRVLVRTTLARYCGMSPVSFKFSKTSFGKPEVDWRDDDDGLVRPSLHFNISHTSSLIACGVTVGGPIGIDVEEKKRKPSNNILSLARRYFSMREVEFLNALSDPASQRDEFIKLWTLKEAYVKAIGRGFAGAPFRDFTIRFEAGKCKQIRQQQESEAFGRPATITIASNILLEVPDDSEDLTANWRFALFELDNSHYVAVCMGRGEDKEGAENDPLRMRIWKTIPLVEDDNVLITDGVSSIAEVY